MKGLWLCAALGAAAPALAQPAPAPPHSGKASVITNPDWVRKPGPDEFSQYYPSRARNNGEQGSAVIECDVTAEGKLAGCVVLVEDPPGNGFGEAALRISRFFQMKPRTRDGVPVGGGTFSTRINFVLGNNAVPPRWRKLPPPEDILKVWPAGAPDKGGEAKLDCEITAKGEAVHCKAIGETPPHSGFGAAAVKLAPTFRFTPATSDGRPINSDAQFSFVFAKPQPSQRGVAKFDRITGLRNAPWQAAPTAADMAAAWPKAAPADLPDAQVRVRCGFSPDTYLTGCTLLSEEPPGYGFGAAALALTSRFRTRGALMEDRLLAIARINLSFDFINPKTGQQAPEWLAQPNWVSFIAEDRITELYPAAAMAAGIKTGRAVVECSVEATGTPTACAVTSEDPPGKGFGQAALAAIASFAVNPWTDDGRPVDGAKIRVPIRFVAADPPPPPQGQGASPAPGEKKP